jgi:CDP-diacylglycerol--glycerol-3-phosphate 3-phosphatidyltransferase
MRQHIPNVLTLLRTILAPLGAAALWFSYQWNISHEVPPWMGDSALAVGGLAQFAVLAFMLAAVSDWLDGFLARRWSVQSAFGALLDPIADKLLINCYLIVYAAIMNFSVNIAVAVFAILLRDILMTALRLTSGKPGDAAIPVSPLAKIKTAIEMVVVAAPFLIVPMGWLASDLVLTVWVAALWIAAALSLLTGIRYLTAK